MGGYKPLRDRVSYSRQTSRSYRSSRSSHNPSETLHISGGDLQSDARRQKLRVEDFATDSPVTQDVPGSDTTQVWGRQKLHPDSHTSSLSATSSERSPCLSIGSVPNVKARLHWNLASSYTGRGDGFRCSECP